MNQLSIFDNNTNNTVFELYVDGASRNNPGKAGAGVFLLKNNKILFKSGFYLGIKTNNQAEYLALLLGLFFVKKYISSNNILKINSDSELLVKQLAGDYAVKNLELKKLYDLVKKNLKDLNLNYKISHVLRENNKIADKLANQAIDQELSIPDEFKKKYEI